MDSSIYPIDLPEAKAYLSMNPEDASQDSFLTTLIQSVSDQLSQWITFSIIERDEITTTDLASTIPLRGPVLTVYDVYAIRKDGTDTPIDWTLSGGHTIVIREVPETTVQIRIRYRVGAHIPPAVRAALLMMLKSSYERRTESPMTPAVWDAISPYTAVNI